MKKVAFVAPTFPVLSETFIRTEVEAIKNCGHEVTVFAFELNQWDEAFDYDLVKIGEQAPTQYWKRIDRKGLVKALSFINEQQSLPKKSLFKYGMKLALQLAEHDIQHVHAHFGQHTTAHAIVAAKLLNISCSFVAHGHDVYETAFDIKQKIASSDFVVAVCQDMFTDFQSMAQGNLKLLHCGVNLDNFVYAPKQPSSTLRLAFLGRLVEPKGIPHLIEALSELEGRIDFQLDIIGTGEMETELQHQVAQLGLQDKIQFLGAKPHQWVKNNLAKYDCLVAPFCVASTGCVDTGPLVLKEAMAVGTPVITSNIMGCKEIVSPSSGYLVSERNVEQLAQSIQCFAALSPQQREAMGKQARERVATKFNADTQATQLSGWIEAA